MPSCWQRGATGGGDVLVGGDWQGSGDIQQATTVTMEQSAKIDASATNNGNGGKIVLWSDVTKLDSKTIVAGSLLAKAGELTGNGGQIETSGHEVEIEGAVIDAGAANGNGGEWLIDPINWIIGSTNAGQITSALNNGTSITIDTQNTTSTPAGANNNNGTADPGLTGLGDITVNSAITKTSGGNATLTMNAANSIFINSAITSTAGELNVTLDADNDAGTGDGGGSVVLGSDITTNGGNLRIGTDGSITIGGNNTKIGGDVYVTNASTISTNGGNVEVSGETIIANAAGLTINSTGGDITFDGAINSGNAYAFVSGAAGTGSWEQARDAAKNGTAGGSAIGDSYIVSVSSRLENSIASSVTLNNGSYRGAWIGSFRDKNASAPNNTNWKWIGGAEADQTFYVQGGASTGQYNNFATGEPNGSGIGGEYAGQFFGSQALWNDLQGSTQYSATMSSAYNVMGFVRETNLENSPLNINAGSGVVSFGAAVGSGKALSNLTINSASAISVGSSMNLSGSLALTLDPTANTVITQSDSWNIGGTSSFTLGSNDFTLNNSSNDFVGSVSIVSADDVSITDANLLTFAGSATLTGDLTITGGRINIDTSITSTGGNISVSGTTLTNTRGIQFSAGADITTAGAGNITLVGDTQNSSAGGASIYGVSFSNGTVLTTDSGDISVTGTGSKIAGNSRGIVVETNNVEIRSASGDITLTDVNPVVTTGAYSGLYLSNGVKIGKGSLASSSSDVTIEADKIQLTGTIDTTGSLTVQSNTNSFASAFNTNTLTLGSTLSYSESKCIVYNSTK